MEIDEIIRRMIRQTVEECLGNSAGADPELIKIEDAATLCGCDRSVIDALVEDAPDNGFPVVRLSTRMIRIDKARLNNWLRSGGLNGTHTEDRRKEIPYPRLKRIG